MNPALVAYGVDLELERLDRAWFRANWHRRKRIGGRRRRRR